MTLYLIGTPEQLNVPYFTPQSGRESSIWDMKQTEIEAPYKKTVDRRAMKWLEDHDIRVVGTRNYEAPVHAAFYATWLRFPTEALLAEFLAIFPRYDIKIRLDQLHTEAREKEADLQRRRERGDFDLSKIGDQQQRENLARIYQERSDEIRELDEEREYLVQALEYGAAWENMP